MMFEIFDSNILNFRGLIQTDIDDMIDLPSELARIGLLGQHSFHRRLSYFRLTHRQRDGHFVAVDRCSYIVEREFNTAVERLNDCPMCRGIIARCERTPRTLML